mgnify:FL=1
MGKAVRILVDGASIQAEEGQSLTSALMMAGIPAVRKSPEGEARGALCAMGTCYECRATVNGVRGVRTCLVAVEDGMRIEREEKLKPSSLSLSSMKDSADRNETVETNLVVIGAGPAGLAAACAAAELGLDVIVIDESIN